MAMISSMFGGRRSSSIFNRPLDPLSFDIWDPFEGTGTLLPSVSREISALATVQIDWRETPEAHIFKADLPGLRKEEVKVEVEDGRVLKISGERTREQERQVAPRGVEHREVPPPLQATRECQDGSSQG